MEKINYLAGANTSSGFVSKFDEINTQNKPSFKYILKGGPGTGKSTLLKKIANHFEEKGLEVERYFCSSDTNSLDAVRIVSLNVCVVDGTAPHEQDASIPGVNSKIINLGECISDKIYKHKHKIEKLLSQKKQCYSLSNAYLKSAGIIKNANYNIDCDIVCEKKLILCNLSNEKNSPKGSLRSAFFEFFNEFGLQSLEEENNFNQIYYVQSSANFSELKQELLNNCFDIVEIFDVISLKPKAIVICGDNILIKLKEKKQKTSDKLLLNLLYRRAGEQIVKAKSFHKKVEAFYFKCLDFDKLNKIANNLLIEIENKKL